MFARLIRIVVGCALVLYVRVGYECKYVSYVYFADTKPWQTRVILMGSSWVANDIDSSFKIRPRPYPSFDILCRSCVLCKRTASMNITGFLLSGRTQKRHIAWPV